MLRQTPSKSAKQAQQYFANCVSKDTRYYVEGQEEAGKWGGKGAELLGLKGDVEQLAFNRLTENRHPITGENQEIERRGKWQITRCRLCRVEAKREKRNASRNADAG